MLFYIIYKAYRVSHWPSSNDGAHTCIDSHALSCSNIMCKQMCSAHTPHLLVSLCLRGHIHRDAYPKLYALGTDKQRRRKYTHIHTKKTQGRYWAQSKSTFWMQKKPQVTHQKAPVSPLYCSCNISSTHAFHHTNKVQVQWGPKVFGQHKVLVIFGDFVSRPSRCDWSAFNLKGLM